MDVGCHDNGYAPVLESLITDNLRQKLVLLPGHVEVAAGIRNLHLGSLIVDNLFEGGSPAPASHPLLPANPEKAHTQRSSKVPYTVALQGNSQETLAATSIISGSISVEDWQHATPRASSIAPMSRRPILKPNIVSALYYNGIEHLPEEVFL
jgi:hypothetical protein